MNTKKVVVKQGKGKKATSVEGVAFIDGPCIKVKVGEEEQVLCTCHGEAFIGRKRVPLVERTFADFEQRFPDLVPPEETPVDEPVEK